MDQVTLRDLYSRLGSIEAKIDNMSPHDSRINALEQARAKLLGMSIAASTLVSAAIAFWSTK